MTTHEPLSKLLKGGNIGDYIRDYYGVIKGDTRSLDNGSHCPVLNPSAKSINWAVVKELKLSYYTKDTLLFTICP